ncbi:carboxypeptidase D [Malassezia cuniculi]|uniref:Carboxypeptidase D n=1 Tax=Malassezia cuniculi TaxID=948313 RepID=A0AAF0J781_9BASI|nr:carboxypeptidase D [Malassezia cuniculi]
MRGFAIGAALCASLVLDALAVTFSGDKAKGFEVKNLPKVDFDLGPSWAGNLPVSNDTNEDKKLFFWMFPPAGDVGHDDVVVWLNGGPGCSSLEGLFQENGPFKFATSDVNSTLIPNEHSWSNLSYVVWIESPVGVGFTKGEPTIQGMYGQARQMYGFLQQFFDTFSELKGKRLWFTGESYAGKYIPYIAHEIYQHDDTKDETGINLQGIAINDPSFTSDFLSEEAPAFEFFEQYHEVMGVNKSDVEDVRRVARKQGIETFVADNLHYPPKGLIHKPAESTSDYIVWDLVYRKGVNASECFSVYNIKSNCDEMADPMGFPLNATVPSKKNFLNENPDFKKALNVDPNTQWLECTISLGDVFKNKTLGDVSPPPDRTVLPGVIEKSKRTVIQHGTWDFILIANGTQLAIQNMTWSGMQGFQNKPNLTLTAGEKPHGVFHEERGLTLALVAEAGHMVPQFKPQTAFALQQYLLGQVSKKDITA